MTFSVYVLQNTFNNKVYVGFSTNPEARWAAHKSVACRPNNPDYNNPLYCAIRKHRWESFDKHVIETWSAKSDALEAERFWIEFFRSNIRRFGPSSGYNFTDGGDSPPSCKGRPLSPETRARMCGRVKSEETRSKLSKALMGHECSTETRAKIGASKRGNTNCVGRVISAETKAKIAAAHRGRKASPETRAKMSASQIQRNQKDNG